MKKFQIDNQLPVGQLDKKTLSSLDILFGKELDEKRKQEKRKQEKKAKKEAKRKG